MMMPIGIQHLQMSLVARVGMGLGLSMGMGAADMSTMAQPQLSPHPFVHSNAATSTVVPPAFVVPPILSTQATPQGNPNPSAMASQTFPDPYCNFLAQVCDI